MILKTWFITGTDTGAGKTVLTALLARHWHQQGLRVAAIKPVCSGDRSDAQKIFAALEGSLPLDEINPWHFRAAIAPLLAARREKKTVTLSQIRQHVRRLGQKAEVTLIEGAGGLLSPLGENVDSRDLIAAFCAIPIIVAPNQLGVINHLRLTLAALPPNAAREAWIVLRSLPKPDAASRSNAQLLAEFFPAERILKLPWLGEKFSLAEAVKKSSVRHVLFSFDALG